MSPSQTIGRAERAALTPTVWCEPARMSRTVPATGRRATMPGNGWLSWMANADTASRTAPAAPSSRATATVGTGMRARARASSAPAANSQARVREE